MTSPAIPQKPIPMDALNTAAHQEPSVSRGQMLVRIVLVLVLLFIFLIGIKGLGGGFKMLGKDMLSSFFHATENPFVGLVIGILATTLVQSSSVTTSMIVGMVAAPDNPLPIANAIPMIMGANIGTTVTNTIVSLAHMARPAEFKRAFAVATCHDFFNFMTVAVLLPLEMATGILLHTATFIADLIGGAGGYHYKSPIKVAIKAGLAPVKGIAHALFDSKGGQAGVLIIISMVIIVVALALVVKVLRSSMESSLEKYISALLGKSAVLSMAVGVLVTVSVQSSSITTSLLVPLAGAGIVSLRHAFPITLGANVGTTVTALLASLAVSGTNAHFGITIALVHLLFNLLGILMVYPFKKVRHLPLIAAEKLAEVAVKSKKMALVYVCVLFYLLPALLVMVSQWLRE